MEELNKLGDPNKRAKQANGNGCIFIAVTIFMLVIMLFTCDGCKNDYSSDKSTTTDDVSITSKSEETKQSNVPTNTIDREAAKELKKYFNFKKDEFDAENKVWVEPKNRPRYTNENCVFCYFQMNGDTPSNFRFVIQYTADEWLFIENYTFNVDGFVFDYSPDKIERDNNSTIWEWSDCNPTLTDMSLINALVIAKKVKIKFNGKQYSRNRNLTKKEISYIKRTVQYYRALGGTFN